MAREHRLQILIDDELHRRIAAAARARGRGLTSADGVRRPAGLRLLVAQDMPVPEPDDVRAELDSVRGRRA